MNPTNIRTDEARFVALEVRGGSRSHWWRRLLRKAFRNPAVIVSVAFLLVVVLAAIVAPLIATNPAKVNPRERLQGPSSEHWMGTDSIGRDVFARVVYGARVSVRIAVAAVLLSKVAAIALGLMSGYWQGKFDMVLQRLMDTLQAFPGLILAMLIVAMFGRGESKILLPLALLALPGTLRVVRGSVLSAKQADYVLAAKVFGVGTPRILVRHILPNILAPIIVLVSLQMGGVILAEASLSFLGLGVQPPAPSWGGMLAADGRQHLERAPYLLIFPALAISLTILALNLIGDGLRDALDPRLRGR